MIGPFIMRLPGVAGFNLTMTEANSLSFAEANALLKLLPKEKEAKLGEISYR